MLAALVGCAAAPTGDAALADRLFGKWSFVRGSAERVEQSIQLDPDGVMTVKGIRHSGQGSRNISFRGRWHVKDGVFHYTGLPMDPAGSCGGTGQQQERIVAVTDTEWIMTGQCTGRELRAWRYPK